MKREARKQITKFRKLFQEEISLTSGGIVSPVFFSWWPPQVEAPLSDFLFRRERGTSFYSLDFAMVATKLYLFLTFLGGWPFIGARDSSSSPHAMVSTVCFIALMFATSRCSFRFQKGVSSLDRTGTAILREVSPLSFINPSRTPRTFVTIELPT